MRVTMNNKLCVMIAGVNTDAVLSHIEDVWTRCCLRQLAGLPHFLSNAPAYG